MRNLTHLLLLVLLLQRTYAPRHARPRYQARHAAGRRFRLSWPAGQHAKAVTA